MKRLARRFGCPVELSIEILGGKWKPVILARLKDHSYRYSELRKLIPGLSTKMLTERLIALGAPLPLEFLFDPGVDVSEPQDRTTSAAE